MIEYFHTYDSSVIVLRCNADVAEFGVFLSYAASLTMLDAQSRHMERRTMLFAVLH